MCGIIFAKSLNNNIPVNRYVIEQFEDQRSRGTEGFGIALLKKDGTIERFKSTDEINFLIDLQPKLNASTMILAHHRQPTSTPNYSGQTHPILVTHELFKRDYLITHNGMIGNSNERKTEHDKFFQELADEWLNTTVKTWTDKEKQMKELMKYKLFPKECFDDEENFLFDKAMELGDKIFEQETIGYHYQTELDSGKFNDSEALAIDLACYMEGLTDKIEAKGGAAFVGLAINKDTDKPEKLFFGRNSNPLRLSRDSNHISISSEGKGEPIDTDKIFVIDLLNQKYPQISFDLEIKPYYTTPTYNSKAVTVTENTPTHLETPTLPSTNPIIETLGQEDEENTSTDRLNQAFLDAEQELEDELTEFIDLVAKGTELAEAQKKITTITELMYTWLEDIQKIQDEEEYELMAEGRGY
ncbi:hypothetical protein M0R04_06550 [Candidatus Dojkabacteria bacterium]|jgi:predicted glutamine amidotransferase|nr:hypothetical protein [Candidatus Dojkabacteria bacterium]